MRTKMRFIAFFLLIFSACSHEKEVTVSDTEEFENNVYDKVMQLENETARKLAVRETLTPDEQYLFWQKRLLEISNDLRLSDDQKIIVKKLKDFIEPQTFVPESDAYKRFLEFEVEWRIQAFQVFNVKGAKTLFASLEDTKMFHQANLVMVDDCDCSATSDYCDDGNKCTEKD